MPDQTQKKPAESPANATVSDLLVKAHTVTLNPGLFCLYHNFSQRPHGETGLPTVRIAPAFDRVSEQGVTITALPPEGESGSAVLVRARYPNTKIIVTVYQQKGREDPLQLQLFTLGEKSEPETSIPPADVESSEIVAHIQRSGDVGGSVGDWVGTRGSGNWIEGFRIRPDNLPAEEIEYQAILGHNWTSPWVSGGAFCGSRGMALPLLGFAVQLKGDLAETHECSYTGCFVGGTQVGPISAGDPCESGDLAALEAFTVVIQPRSVVRLNAAGKRPKRTK